MLFYFLFNFVSADEILSTWQPTDQVEIYLGSELLNAMRLSDTEVFEVHHQGLLFHNFRARRWLTVDYFMAENAEIAHMFVTTKISIPPDMGIWQMLLGYVSGSLYEFFEFENFGEVRVLETMVRKPAEFEQIELVHIGSTVGANVVRTAQWVLAEHNSVLQFDVFSLYNIEGTRIRKSKTCYDFVEDVLTNLEWVPSNTEELPFREGVVLNVTKLEKLDMSVPKRRRDYLRFVRLLRGHMHQLGQHLIYIRMFIVKVAEMGLPYMIALDGWEMHAIEFSPDSADNHCALPLEFTANGTPLAANLGDVRRSCFLPHASRADWVRIIQYSWTDWAIWLEARIDTFLVGEDGQGSVWWTTVWIGLTIVGLLGILKLHK